MISEEFVVVTFAIAIIACLYAAVLRYVMYEIGGMRKIMERNKEIQKEMREINKKYIDAARARRDKELKVCEQKMNAMAAEMMKSQVKVMVITLPLLIVSALIANELRVYFSDYAIVLPVHLPVPHLSFENFINWRNTFGPVGWFWIVFLFFSFVSQIGLDRKGGVKDAKAK
ncbi:MAG: EMC3/TMCO1 family protein [Candidatus Micrarchaeia archaeon]